MGSRIHNLAFTAALACLGIPALAATADSPLTFNALQQSLWGGGPSAAFGSAQSFGLGPVVFSYDVGASSGTVSATVNGKLAVDYATTLTSPGLTTLSLDFFGTPGGGLLKSDLGAWLEVTGTATPISIPIIDKGFSLNVNQGFTPQIGSTAAGMDSAALTGAGINLGVAEVGANFDIDQTDRFTPTALNGLLEYGLRGSGITNSLPFSIASLAGLDLSVPLGQSGTWDFAVRNLSLSNSFSTAFDASLVFYEKHINGIDWCGSLFPYPCGFNVDRNEVTLASIDLYDASPFALAFNTIANGPAFSVAVIPEPGTLPMLALGLAVLGAMRMHATNRRRRVGNN